MKYVIRLHQINIKERLALISKTLFIIKRNLLVFFCLDDISVRSGVGYRPHTDFTSVLRKISIVRSADAFAIGSVKSKSVLALSVHKDYPLRELLLFDVDKRLVLNRSCTCISNNAIDTCFKSAQ